jgi:diguanylate cyclase (GGDEF)-like protein
LVLLAQNARAKRRALAALSQEHDMLEQRVSDRTLELRESNSQLAILSVTDDLTGLANRRRFDKALDIEFARVRRSEAMLSLIMIDIDHFKSYNDNYGHVAGDACLQRVAALIASRVNRAPDLAARYGGEEFAIIMPETDARGARLMAEKIRSGIVDLQIPHAFSPTSDVVTVSLGVVTVETLQMESPKDVINLADEELYRAKANGRNQVSVNLVARQTSY